MDHCPWHQVNIAFPDWADSEPCAVTHLAPLLAGAEAKGLIASWFFIRKAPCWRVRYLPAGDVPQVQDYIRSHLESLKSQRHIENAREIVYEPETHAFGGSAGMASAHRLFHSDSQHLLAHLADPERPPGSGHRRELSILLCTGLLRAAGLDWYEQGDVWARVAEHREQIPASRIHALETGLRRLMSVDAQSLMREGSSLAFADGWAAGFAAAGRELADLAADGKLDRGLRAILAHHIVFAWNRLGLPSTTQAVLASTAKAVVFGQGPTREHQPVKGEQPWTAPAEG